MKLCNSSHSIFPSLSRSVLWNNLPFFRLVVRVSSIKKFKSYGEFLRHTFLSHEPLMFHHHEKDNQKNVFEHALEVQTLRVLVLHILIFSSGSTAEKSILFRKRFF
jgi:hypothetical protein